MKSTILKFLSLSALPVSLCIIVGLFATCQPRFSNDQGLASNFATAQTQPTPVDRCKNLKTAPALFGVTITDLGQAKAAKGILRSLVADNDTMPVVVRVVFDPIQKKSEFEDQLNDYWLQVKDLRDGTNVCLMGTIADSYNMHSYLPDRSDPSWPDGFRNYERWTRRLVAKMGELIDIWEVGNEVNGEWYGWEGKKYKKGNEQDEKQDREMRGKRETMRNRIKHELGVAFKAVREVRPQALTAITLLYNADQEGNKCTEFSEYKMND